MMQRLLIFVVMVWTLAGCGSSGLEALKVVRYESDEANANTTVVLLRGIGGSHLTFDRRGWVEAVRERGFDWTVVAPDTDYGYYRARTVVTRLAEDVVGPARARGQAKVWLVGVSMGGLGSLYYLIQRPDEVAGAVLIAPYLGPPEVAAEIKAAGGLKSWQAPHDIGDEDWGRQLWSSIQRLLKDNEKPIFLAYGDDDRNLMALRVLAEALPEDRILVIPGGHRKPVFDALWSEILDRGVIR